MLGETALTTVAKKVVLGAVIYGRGHFGLNFVHNINSSWTKQHKNKLIGPYKNHRPPTHNAQSLSMRHRKMATTSVVLSTMLLLFTLILATESSDVDFLTISERRDLQDEYVCPYADEERLLYNIEVDIEGVGEGCETYDLYNIGKMLQDIVDEVEEEIPKYKKREKMETTICPYPLKEEIRRNLRAVANDESRERSLQQPNNRPSKKRYKYRGSGKCRRCRKNNNDRQLQETSFVDDTCEKADMATYAASIAAVAVKNSGEIISDIRKYVLKHCDYMTSGQETVFNAKEWMQEGRESLKIAQREARRARSQCQLAKRTTTDMDRIQYMRIAGTASSNALNAAENARSRYFQLRDELDTNICFQESTTNGVGRATTVQSICNQADLAEFGADLTATAVLSAGESFKKLQELAMQCSDLGSPQGLVTDAKGKLGKVKEAQKRARTTAKKARIQCQLAQGASSGAELMQYMEQAQEQAGIVMDATERADSGCVQLRDIAKQSDICYTQGKPSMDISVKAVCERANAAAFGADIATTVFKNANAAFADLRERALDCKDLASGQVWITRAKGIMTQCQTAQKLAMKQARLASAQCRNARNAASDSELKEYLIAAGMASSAALDAAKTAKSRLLIIQNDGSRDVCSQGVKAVSTAVSAQSVCQNAEIASFGADMTSTAVVKANAAYVSLRESAMDCNDLILGKSLATEAMQSLKLVQQSRKLATNGARRAKQECNSAEQATSPDELRQQLSKAKMLADDSMKAAEQAQTNLSLIRDNLSAVSCKTGVVIERSPMDASEDNADIEATFATEETYFVSGGKKGGRNASLRLWLVQLANMLYDKIPKELMKTYGSSPTPDGCKLQAFKVNIQINAFEQIGDSKYWIKDKSDCIVVRL